MPAFDFGEWEDDSDFEDEPQPSVQNVPADEPTVDCDNDLSCESYVR